MWRIIKCGAHAKEKRKKKYFQLKHHKNVPQKQESAGFIDPFGWTSQREFKKDPTSKKLFIIVSLSVSRS